MGDTVQEYDHVLEPDTVLISENFAGWFNLLYRTLPLKDGESLSVPVIFTEQPDLNNLIINVHLEETEVEGETVRIYVCEIPALGEAHYVDTSGILQAIRIPEKNVTIQLANP